MATAQSLKKDLSGNGNAPDETPTDAQSTVHEAPPPTAEMVVLPPASVGRNPLAIKVEYAKLLASSGLLPAQYRRQPANLLWAIEYGEMLGLSPMAAITGVHVIEGKPTASAGLISALVRRAGHRLRVKGDDTSATCTIIRSDDSEHPFEVTWTIARATQAGLTGKGTWQKYPAAMLKARAITECARDACEEALSGVHYTPEELGAEVAEDGEPIRVDPFTGEIHEAAPTDYPMFTKTAGVGTAPADPVAATTPHPGDRGDGTPTAPAAPSPAAGAPSPAQLVADKAVAATSPDVVVELGKQAFADGLLDVTVTADADIGPLGKYLAHRVAVLRNGSAEEVVDAEIVDDEPTVEDARAAASAWAESS